MKSRWVFLAACIVLLGCGDDAPKKNGEPCSGSEDCESGYCEAKGDEGSTCQDRCIPNGNACGPSGQSVSACCSGYCGANGTCE